MDTTTTPTPLYQTVFISLQTRKPVASLDTLAVLKIISHFCFGVFDCHFISMLSNFARNVPKTNIANNFFWLGIQTWESNKLFFQKIQQIFTLSSHIWWIKAMESNWFSSRIAMVFYIQKYTCAWRIFDKKIYVIEIIYDFIPIWIVCRVDWHGKRITKTKYWNTCAFQNSWINLWCLKNVSIIRGTFNTNVFRSFWSHLFYSCFPRWKIFNHLHFSCWKNYYEQKILNEMEIPW